MFISSNSVRLLVVGRDCKAVQPPSVNMLTYAAGGVRRGRDLVSERGRSL